MHLQHGDSDFGCIIVSGYPATYRMETAHSCFSWNDTTIGNVVKKLCAEAKVQLELNPAYKETRTISANTKSRTLTLSAVLHI